MNNTIIMDEQNLSDLSQMDENDLNNNSLTAQTSDGETDVDGTSCDSWGFPGIDGRNSRLTNLNAYSNTCIDTNFDGDVRGEISQDPFFAGGFMHESPHSGTPEEISLPPGHMDVMLTRFQPIGEEFPTDITADMENPDTPESAQLFYQPYESSPNKALEERPKEPGLLPLYIQNSLYVQMDDNGTDIGVRRILLETPPHESQGSMDAIDSFLHGNDMNATTAQTRENDFPIGPPPKRPMKTKGYFKSFGEKHKSRSNSPEARPMTSSIEVNLPESEDMSTEFVGETHNEQNIVVLPRNGTEEIMIHIPYEKSNIKLATTYQICANNYWLSEDEPFKGLLACKDKCGSKDCTKGNYGCRCSLCKLKSRHFPCRCKNSKTIGKPDKPHRDEPDGDFNGYNNNVVGFIFERMAVKNLKKLGNLFSSNRKQKYNINSTPRFKKLKSKFKKMTQKKKLNKILEILKFRNKNQKFSRHESAKKSLDTLYDLSKYNYISSNCNTYRNFEFDEFDSYDLNQLNEDQLLDELTQLLEDSVTFFDSLEDFDSYESDYYYY